MKMLLCKHLLVRNLLNMYPMIEVFSMWKYVFQKWNMLCKWFSSDSLPGRSQAIFSTPPFGPCPVHSKSQKVSKWIQRHHSHQSSVWHIISTLSFWKFNQTFPWKLATNIEAQVCFTCPQKSKLTKSTKYLSSCIFPPKWIERVRFGHGNVHFSANHNSSCKKSWAVIGWEVYIFDKNHFQELWQ